MIDGVYYRLKQKKKMSHIKPSQMSYRASIVSNLEKTWPCYEEISLYFDPQNSGIFLYDMLLFFVKASIIASIRSGIIMEFW